MISTNYPRYTVVTYRLEDLDWSKWQDLWRRSTHKPLNCHPAWMQLYARYWGEVAKKRARALAGLRVCVATDEKGTWVGGFPCLVDRKFKNLIFWKHQFENNVIELLELPEYGVLDAGCNYQWLLGVDFSLDEWSSLKGSFQAVFTFKRASWRGVVDYSAAYATLTYVVNISKQINGVTHTWRDMTPKKFVKEIDKALARYPHTAKLVDGEEAAGYIEWAMREYFKKWIEERRDPTVRHRTDDLFAFQEILKAACRHGLALVSVMELATGEKSVEVGIYNADSRAYIVPFVCTDVTDSKTPLGAMHMAWTMDEVGRRLGALTYDQGTGEVEFKHKWAPTIVPYFNLTSLSAKSQDLRIPGKEFVWTPKKVTKSPRKPRKSYSVSLPITTDFGRKSLLATKPETNNGHENHSDVHRGGAEVPASTEGPPDLGVQDVRAQQNSEPNAP